MIAPHEFLGAVAKIVTGKRQRFFSPAGKGSVGTYKVVIPHLIPDTHSACRTLSGAQHLKASFDKAGGNDAEGFGHVIDVEVLLARPDTKQSHFFEIHGCCQTDEVLEGAFRVSGRVDKRQHPALAVGEDIDIFLTAIGLYLFNATRNESVRIVSQAKSPLLHDRRIPVDHVDIEALFEQVFHHTLARNQVKDKTLVGCCHHDDHGDSINFVTLRQVVVELQGALVIKQFFWRQADLSGTRSHVIESLDATLDRLVQHIVHLLRCWHLGHRCIAHEASLGGFLVRAGPLPFAALPGDV